MGNLSDATLDSLLILFFKNTIFKKETKLSIHEKNFEKRTNWREWKFCQIFKYKKSCGSKSLKKQLKECKQKEDSLKKKLKKSRNWSE